MSKHVSTGQITITDQNDYIFTGLTPPSNPIVGLTLWIDTSITPNQLKRWTGSVWEVVSDFELNGRNLFIKFKVTTAVYLLEDGTHNASSSLWGITDFIPVSSGAKYVASGYINLGTAPSTCFYDSNKNFVSGIKNNNSMGVPANDQRRIVTIPPGCSFMRFSFETQSLNTIKIEKGDVATSWTASPEDIQNDISIATTKLADIASDSKLTPLEKQGVKKDWDIIVSEYAKNITHADSLGVNRTAYTTAYDALSSYIAPLISSLTTTSTIVGSTFITTFKNYYDALTDLQNTIQAKISDVKIGGTNLLPNSSFEDGLSGWIVHGSAIAQNHASGYNGGKCLYLPGVGQSNAGLQIQNYVCEAGQVYTFSFVARVIVVGSRVVFGWKDSVVSAIRNLSALPLNTWRKVEITFTGDGSAATFYLISSGYEVYVDHLKLEKGNKATDWSPSPNDAVKVGARNLLRNSGTPVTNSSYNTRSYPASLILANTKYTIVVKANVSVGQRIGAWWNGGSIPAVIFTRVEGDNVYYAHVTSPASITSQSLHFYNFTSGSTSMTIYYACMYEGYISPPMDWVPAPEDFQSQFDDISSDNRLTPDEKQSAQREWSAIQGEVTAIRNQADTFQVSRTVYDATYSTLSSYITPFLASLTTTSDIVGSTFRTRFNDYYTARTNLLLAISQKQKDNLDNMVIGGVNLTEHSNFILEAPAGVNFFSRVLVGSVSGIADSKLYLTNGKTYVFSVERITKLAGSATAVSLLIYDFIADASSGNLYSLLNFTNTRQEVIFTVPATGYWSLLIYAGVVASTAGNKVEYGNLMVQEGNKATNFNPATKHIAEAIKGSTEITGGLVATNLLMLKNAIDEITGGLSGLNSDNIGFWSGGTYQQALLGLAKAIIRKDGSGQLASGNILWDTAGNITLKGIIEALGGKIGGLNIFANALSSPSMKFSESAVESLASLLTPTSVNITRQSSWTSASGGLAFTQNLVLTVDSEVKFRVTATANGTEKGWSVEVRDSLGYRVAHEYGSGEVTNRIITFNLPAGTYIIRAESFSIVNLPDTPVWYVDISGFSNSDTITATGYVSQTKIGNNGFYSFWSNALYMYFSADHGLEVKGSTNIPGVLATGSISSGGTHTNMWGAKTSSNSVTKGGTGIYNVPHNVGSSAFTVLITCRTDNMNARITGKTSTTFQVTIRNMSGSPNDANFDYVILGSN